MAVLHTIAIKCAKVRRNLLGQVKPVYLGQTFSITCLYAVFFFSFLCGDVPRVVGTQVYTLRKHAHDIYCNISRL